MLCAKSTQLGFDKETLFGRKQNRHVDLSLDHTERQRSALALLVQNPFESFNLVWTIKLKQMYSF